MIRALAFDIQGTTVDFHRSVMRMGAAVNTAKGLAIDWAAMSRDWRALYRASMDAVIAGQRPWLTADRIYREALDHLLTASDLSRSFTGAERDAINAIWSMLDPWPDSVAGLIRLRRRFTLATLSNAAMPAIVAVVRHAGLPFDCLLSASLVRRFKPDPAVYRLAVENLGFAPEAIMMVASHKYDLHAARAFGMKTAFVARPLEFDPMAKLTSRPIRHSMSTRVTSTILPISSARRTIDVLPVRLEEGRRRPMSFWAYGGHDMDLGIAGRVAVVTGADSGMGFAVTRFLLEAGAKVMMTDREPETLEAEAHKLHGKGTVATFASDLTKVETIEALRQATESTFSPADILVHAAGITGPVGDFLEIDDEGWAKTIEIDFMAAVRLCRVFIPAMKRRGWGRIVLFSSEDGLQPYIEDLPYCACKAAILNLSKGLSKAYGQYGLTVNAVLPAFIASPMTDAMMEQRAKDKGLSFDEAVSSFLDEHRPGIAIGRRGLANEVASAVAYLCSAHASYVNGTAMRVDGGSVATI